MPRRHAIAPDARPLPSTALGRRAAKQLAAAIVVVVLVGMVPVAAAWPGRAAVLEGNLPTWQVVLILGSALQLAYAAYLGQLASPMSLIVTASVLLLVTCAYVTLLAVRLLVPDTHPWMRFWHFDTNGFTASQETAWCLMMAVLTGTTTYVAGRAWVRWRHWTQLEMAPPASEPPSA